MLSSEEKRIGPKCFNKGQCFARKCGQCSILTKPVFGECPFKKGEREITDGKEYPYNHDNARIYV